MTDQDPDDIRPITLDLIGLLTSVINQGVEEPEPEYMEAFGSFAVNLMPTIEIPGPMTAEQLSDRLSAEMTKHTIKLLSAFAFVFSELGRIHDEGVQMTTAEVLRQLSLDASREDL
ncbi:MULTISPECIES: hypothetical protein [unclassified Streptomyces]|uniref:hypothetical protein n=1 Tax=unclassified Streptomyces TaxID=2593676 RepID=UPI0036519D58